MSDIFEKSVERISYKGIDLAYVVRQDFRPDNTTFVTPPEFKQQIGFVVYPRNGEVLRHYHCPTERRLVGTSEVIIVKSGRCITDIYSESKVMVKSIELTQGDLILFVSGGHGIRMVDDTVLLEIKQGPYTGVDEKVRF